MLSNLQGVFLKSQERLRQASEMGYGAEDILRSQNADKFRKTVEESIHGENEETRSRIISEYFGYGPLESLFADTEISEILVNGPASVWLERAGKLHQHPDRFLSPSTYTNCFHRLCEKASCQSSVDSPSATGQFEDFRLTIIRQELTRNNHHFSFRRHPKNPWNFDRLLKKDWCTLEEVNLLKAVMQSHKNFMIIGGTGSGKTSLINALLQTVPENERVVVIEDTPEIELPNTSSMKMVTREDPQGILKNIDQAQLLRHALRLRPDRLVMGEVRGVEAKDLLMALATGHGGSFGTLHASDPRQALLRLEMLIQMGAPQWSLPAVRRLIQLSLDYILVVGKSPDGNRKFQGAYKVCSLEENGFLVERIQNIY
ncbi:MAG: CpaF family protein [Bdellovibrionaceae bacterium]|nr:CpaF family protein [Pseudobdellovibrionaceae bacterium]